MKRKTGLWLLIFVCCTMFFFPSALGAPGDANLFTQRSGNEYVQSAAAVGDSMYFLGNKGLYHWNKEMKEPQLASEDIQTWLSMAREEDSGPIALESFDGSIQVLIGSEDTLWGLNITQGILCKLEEKEGKWAPVPVVALDWTDMVITEGSGQDSWTQSKDISSPVIQNNMLYLLSTDYRSFDSGKDLIAFNLDTGEQKKIEVEDIQNIACYEGEKLWALQFNRSKAYNNATDGKIATPVLGVIDVGAKSFEAKSSTPHIESSGLAYNQKDQSLYLSGGGSIYRWDGAGEFAFVNYIPFHDSWDGGKGILLDGGQLYGIYAQNKVYVRNLDSSLAPDQVLSIYGAYASSNEVESFEKNHPEIPLKLIEREWDKKIGERMFLGDSEADLYRINLNYDQYKSMKEKGYTVDLSSNQVLTEGVAQMYPEIQQALHHNEALVAIPVDFTVTTTAYAPSLFEELNLTPPETWQEVMALYGLWGEELAEEYPEYYVSTDMYFDEERASARIFEQVMNDYAVQKLLRGEPLRFDSPAFRDALKALEENKTSMDLIDTGNSMTFYHDNPTHLIELSRYVTPQGYNNGGYVIQPFGFTKGEEVLFEGMLEVYIINPHSQNKEMAMLFLENLVQDMSPYLKVALYPNNNDPVPEPSMVAAAEEALKEIEETKKLLETADDQGKKMLEEQISWQEEWQANIEDESYYWMISAEDIETYRKWEGRWKIIEENPLRHMGTEETRGLFKDIENYTQGVITADQLIQRLDQKIQMIEMEGQ